MELQADQNMYMIEAIYPYSIEIPEIITSISRKITRNSTLLIKLIQLLQEDGANIPNLDYMINRITKKLGNQLILLETYYKTEQEEYNAIDTELKDAQIDRDALHIKSRIKEISDEEYSIKLSVANWTIEDLSLKRDTHGKIIKAMEDLKSLQLFSDIDELYKITKDNYKSLENLKIEAYTREKLINTLSKIMETITNKRPSTI